MYVKETSKQNTAKMWARKNRVIIYSNLYCNMACLSCYVEKSEGKTKNDNNEHIMDANVKLKGSKNFQKKKTNSDDSAKQIVSVTMFFSKQVLHREHFFIPKLIELERSIEKLDVPMILVV